MPGIREMAVFSHRTLVACALAIAPLLPLSAQAPSSLPAISSQLETREQLEAQASALGAQHRTSEAWLLRSRLEKGDFREGDRIVLLLDANPRPDTLQVRVGNVLQFPGMSDLPLDGVLRSELQATLRHHLAKYLRNPDVRVTPLISLAILGSVAAPGYYYTTADVVLRDAIMRAGGPRGGNLEKITIRRGGQVLWKSEDVRVALQDGLSLDRLHLRAGDEIVVPAERRFNVAALAIVVSTSIALVTAILSAAR